MTFKGSLVSWKSRKQDCASLSSNEAEYVALSETSREAVCVHGLLSDLGLHHGQALKMHLDNKGAIDLVSVDGQTKWSKHINLCYPYLRQVLQEGLISVKYIQSTDMLADGLTKLLDTTKFQRFVGQLFPY